MTASERRYAILTALCRRRYDTRANHAFEFGVSKRTIEHDVMLLSLKFPVYTKQGGGGGIFVMAGFLLDRPGMNERQLRLLRRLFATLSGEDRDTVGEMLRIYG